MFADWVNGIYLIKIGENERVHPDSDFKYFKATESIFLHIINGEIQSMNRIYRDFEFNYIPKDNEPLIIKYIKENRKSL